MGLRIPRDVIVRNKEQIYQANLSAIYVEMDVAVAIEAYGHIADQLGVIGDLTNDPFVPVSSKEDNEYLSIWAKQLLKK
jgi:hypothetical protein